MLLPEAALAGEVNTKPRLQGTFLQLLKAHKEWREEDWARLFDNFKELKLSQVVVQWSVFGDTEFYLPGNTADNGTSTIEMIMRQADRAGMRVLVGLAHEPRFWEEIKRPAPQVDDYFRKSLLKSLAVAERLGAMLKSHESFEGWYLTEEIDDITWVDNDAKRALFDYLRDTSLHLHATKPSGKVALSGFTNGKVRPEDLETFWRDLLEHAKNIDIVLFQDGIGTGKLDLPKLPSYLTAIGKAVNSSGRELRAVTEIFRQIGGPPLDDKKFRAVPADLERIQLQLKAAAPFASQLVAFSIPEYMSPFGGLEAARLFKQYLYAH